VTILLRLILFAIISELGISYSLHAEVDNLPKLHLTKDYTCYRTTDLKADSNIAGLILFEFFEKDEQNEVNEDESEDFNVLDLFGSFTRNYINCTRTKLINQGINYLFFKTLQPLFIIFHCWKFHI